MAGRGAHSARHARRRAPDRHFLRPPLAAAIVADACVLPAELVLDVGAGSGRLTAELERTGAHVRAIELDRRLAEALRRRFPASERVEIVEGNALAVPLPREPFRVVANLPFGCTTAVLRRLLNDPRVPLTRADVVVEWDLARKRTACWPSTLLGVCWAAWFDLALVRRLPGACFEPAPTVDAAVMRIERRLAPLVPVREAARFHLFVRRGFERGMPCGRVAKRALRELGVAPGARARELDAYQWAALFSALHRPVGRANVRA